jgi:transcriptional regulator with XRE-family HTH domain
MQATDDVAARILARLDELERNQAWLARKLGLDLSTVFRWLNRERPIPRRRLPKIAAVLGLDVEQLDSEAVEGAAA